MAKPFIFAADGGPLTVSAYAIDANGNRIGGAGASPVDPTTITVSLSNSTGEAATVSANVITPGDTTDGATFEVDVVSIPTPALKGSAQVALTGEPTGFDVEVSQASPA